LKEDHQAPKVISDIGVSFQVLGQEVFDGALPEKLAIVRHPFSQGIDQHRAQRPAKPFVSGNVKPGFLPGLNGGWQLVFTHFTQNKLLL